MVRSSSETKKSYGFLMFRGCTEHAKDAGQPYVLIKIFLYSVGQWVLISGLKHDYGEWLTHKDPDTKTMKPRQWTTYEYS